jgi:hypothetical protein
MNERFVELAASLAVRSQRRQEPRLARLQPRAGAPIVNLNDTSTRRRHQGGPTMGQQILSFLTNGLGKIVGFLPNLISALVILIVGYALSRLLGSVVRRLLARAHFDNAVARHVHPKAATNRSPSATLGSAVFWIGMLVTLSLTARALALGALASGLNRILAFVPNVIVAAIVVGVGIALANVLSDLTGDYAQGWVSKAVKVAIIALAVFMALDQLGIATTVVTTTLAALLGAAAVAFAIAFGVGNIQLARDYSARFVRRSTGFEGTRRTATTEQMSAPPRGREPPPEHPHTH